MMKRIKVTIPTVIALALTLVLVLGAIPAQAAKPNFKPAISFGPLNHRTELTATVDAKAKLTNIELRIDAKKVQPWVKSHAGWKYSIRFPLTKLSVGMHSVKLTVRNQMNFSTQRQWTFQKLAELALSTDRSSIQPGETVVVTGQGFTPGTALTIGMGGVNTGVGGDYAHATADTYGGFTVEVMLDRYPDGSLLHAGTIVLVAHNADGSEKAGTDVRVLPDPKVSTDQTSVKPGDQIRVTGVGFTPGAAISIGIADAAGNARGSYGNAIADAAGGFALNVRLQQQPDGTPLIAGPLTLVAQTADAVEKATITFRVQANPSISASKSLIRAGETVAFTVVGFSPGKVVVLGLAAPTGHGGSYASAIVDASGRVSFQLTLARYPDGTPLPPGGLILMAATPDGERTSVSLQIQATPSIALNKTSIKSGEQVLLVGQGFTPGGSISVSMGPVNGGTGGNYGSAVVDAGGGFSLALSPARYPDGSALSPGAVVLVAHTADFAEKASAQLQIAPNPTISLDRASIQAGERTVVTGQGFTPGTPVFISLGGAAPVTGGTYGTAVADASGRFAVAVTLDRYPNGLPLQAGQLTVVAHSAAWDQAASTRVQIVTLTATPTTAPSGDPILLRGAGFAPGSTMILSLSINGAAPTGNFGATVVDASGQFAFTTRLTQYPGGSPLQAGPIGLVMHNGTWTQRASVQVQIVNRVPAAPSNLHITTLVKGVTSTVSTLVGLQWQDNSASETGFLITATFSRLRGSDTQTWTTGPNATTAQVSFVAGGINPVTGVCFTVSAFNAQGASTPSNQECATL